MLCCVWIFHSPTWNGWYTAQISIHQIKWGLSIVSNCTFLSFSFFFSFLFFFLLRLHTLVPIKLSGRCFCLNTPGSNFIENQHKSWVTIASYSPKKQLSRSDSSAGLMRGNQISRLKYKAFCHSGPAPPGQCPFFIWFYSYTRPTHFLERGKK